VEETMTATAYLILQSVFWTVVAICFFAFQREGAKVADDPWAKPISAERGKVALWTLFFAIAILWPLALI
jgi:hypothetical protein